jgi:UDP-N-acetyl-D-mannosaminuronic acid dehydrogenase
MNFCQLSGIGRSAMSVDVHVIGLGYVGLTLAATLADIGLTVVGVERRKEVVNGTNAAKPHFSEEGLEALLADVVSSGRLKAVGSLDPSESSQIYIITVGTPLGSDSRVRTDFIESATQEVAGNMPDGALVILRSTVKIGTCRHIVAPILDRSGKRYELAMCPERTLEGNALRELRLLPQIIGADTRETRERAAHLFYKLTPTVLQVEGLETAEIIKLVDNTYRDISFAFGNEVARICDAVGVNAMEVIKSGRLGYPRTNVAVPGLVGGPCLEKDPHILCQSVDEYGISLDVTVAARRVNERQPEEAVDFILEEFGRRHSRGSARVALLGLAFKGVPATDDLRGSMSIRVLDLLKARMNGAEIRLFDPVAAKEMLEKQFSGCAVKSSVLDAVRDSDVAIIANNHPLFQKYPPGVMLKTMAPGAFIYDFWNNYTSFRNYDHGRDYFAVGNTRRASK